jgi:ParB family chromosome partitioning protein
VQPTRRQATEEEAASLAKLETDIEEIETALEDSDDDDPRWVQRDRLEADHQALTQTLTSWDPQEMALAGVVISVEHDGRLYFAHGLVAKADVAKLTKLRRQRDEESAKRLRAAAKAEHADTDGDNSIAGECDAASVADEEAPWEEPRATLPRALVRDLTAIRTTAIRRELIKAPHTALALGVFALLRHAVSGYGLPGISLTARPRWLADHDGLAEDREAWIASIPDTEPSLLEWCLAQDTTTLLDALALIVACNIDLAHEDANIDDRRKQALADRIAAIETAPCTTRLEDVDRVAFLKMLSRKTKDDLANAAAQVLEVEADKAAPQCGGARPKGWLPALFVTPGAEPHYELTDAGIAALHAAE